MKKYIKSAGYHGYSMSNNAVDAYANGEMPLSKWTKATILEELQDLEVSPDIIKVAKMLPLADLKAIFLYKSSWHHTSKMYNRTNFYSVNELVSLADIQSYLKKKEPAATTSQPHLYKIYYNGKSYYGVSPNGFTFYIYDNGDIHKVKGLRSGDIDICPEVPDDAKKIYDILVGNL